jgi:DNA-binding PucR family transcriptional regulator
VFLQENGSFKATAERLVLHKNTVQYRIRKAEESLGLPIGENRLNVELAPPAQGRRSRSAWTTCSPTAA